jgi:5-methyltetrahydropteroyltriglutamate--homocysteine methyltransferase
MERSTDRILTTHAGSLPRTEALVELLMRVYRREAVDPAALAAAVADSTRRVVRNQVEAGIDIGNNGEQPRESFFTYVQHRMSGFGGTSDRPRDFRDMSHYPTFRDGILPSWRGRQAVSLGRPPKAIGPIRYADTAPLEQECAGYQAALAAEPGSFVESFMTAPSPGIIATAMQDDYYGRLDAYVDALAEALRTEYEYIVGRGFVLQLDCPDLAMERHTYFGDRPLDDFLAFVELVVGAINRALTNVPRDRVRLHVCWGNYEGPHTFDVPLQEILPLLYRANVGALLLSLANPRHAHEVRLFERMPLPDDMLLIAGVIDTTTNYVEHPEVVAERIEAAARAIGDPTRVIAGTDCGFDTAAGFHLVAEELVWEKLRSLSAGAAIASGRLFGVRAASGAQGGS